MSEPVRSSVPRHHQIAQVLRGRLESGVWGLRAPLATEQRLCEEFGVSRSTLRQALSQLKQAGLLESRAGVGTRGVAAPLKRKIVSSSGDPLHAALGTKPRLTAYGEVVAPPAVAAFFGLRPSSPIWHFVLIHSLDGNPLSVVDSYLPIEFGTELTRATLQRPMHELLWERYGIALKRSVHTLRVARADVDVASMLAIALADPVLCIQSSVYRSEDKPIRWTENYFREDRYQYVAEMDWPAPRASTVAATPSLRRVERRGGA